MFYQVFGSSQLKGITDVDLEGNMSDAVIHNVGLFIEQD